VDAVETIANGDERELNGELGFLEEVLDLVRIISYFLNADLRRIGRISQGGYRNIAEWAKDHQHVRELS